jgi:hypothetical protein
VTLGGPKYRLLILTLFQLIYYTRLELGLYALQGVKFTASLLALTFAICMITFYAECYPLSSAFQVLPDTPDCAVSVLEGLR